MVTTPVPLVLVTSDVKRLQGYDWHAAISHYPEAVLSVAGAVPLMLPALGPALPFTALLDRVDGVLVTGSRSNVHPEHYGEAAHQGAEPYDEQRDSTSLPLIRAAIAVNVPLLCICRGLQELNVALGGTLYANIHDVEGRTVHRQAETRSKGSKDKLFAIRQSVTFEEEGCLAMLAGGTKALVNSVHNQAIRELADGLAIEGMADDGTIEAVRVTRHAHGFAIGVQWHPEYWAQDDPLSRRIFEAFGDAARARAQMRATPMQPAAE